MRSIMTMYILAVFMFIGAFASTGMAIDESVVGLWLFDEGEGGVAVDSSEKSNNGTIVGAEWVDGKFGKALQLDEDDYIEVPFSESLNLSDSWTLEAWINWSGGQNAGNFNMFIVAKGMPSNNACIWVNKNTENFMVELYDGAYKTIDSTFTIKSKQWFHVAGTYDGKVMKAYVNGELKNSMALQSASNQSDGSLIIGSSGHVAVPNGYTFPGIIDEVRISNRPLTQEEIKKSMAGFTAVEPLGKLATTWSRIKSGQ